MSDRREELLRQRALLQEHMAWLDREIAKECGAQPPVPVPPPQGFRPPPMPVVSAPMPDAEAIMAEYRRPSMSIASQTKFGCIAYFAGAMALIALVIAGFYFYLRSHMGH